MRGIRANQLRLPHGRPREQIAADIARGQAHRAQAGNLDMREILADALLVPQHLLDRRRNVGRSALIGEALIDARGQVAHRIEQRAAFGKARAREFMDLAGWPDVPRGAGIEDRLESLGPKVRPKLRRDIVPARRIGGIEVLRRLHIRPRPRMDREHGVVLLDGDDGGGIAEIVDQIGFRSGSRVDRQAVVQDFLPRMLPGLQMQQMMGLRNRRRIAVDCAMADLENHACCPNRAATRRSSSSVRLK